MDAVAKQTQLNALALTVVTPYIVITIVLVLLAIGVYLSKLPEITPEDEEAINENVVHRSSVFKYPYLWLGFIALFLYVGVEVMAGDIIQLYGNAIGIKLQQARHFTTYTMVSMLAGYIIGIATMPKIITQAKALTVSAVLGVVFTLAAIFTSGFTSVLFIALLGLANALMWPAIWPLAIEGLGRFTNFGAALLIVGIAGGGTIPRLWTTLGGYLHTGQGYTEANAYQTAFWIMIPCYIFIFYFAVKGNKVGKAA
jgi:glucose/galactose transporter